MYDKKKHLKLTQEKQVEHKFSDVVHHSSSSLLKSRQGKPSMRGYTQVAGRGLRGK